ncbi:MAG: hypothetical protein CM1200mP10_33580 [Candidatus Neomarinimicrobiota bacterium]|nr:MAG: hypothetical protein CM1200mP10_33580 [Candidatus Neomarinimicrobiota bacterium]
MDLCHLIHRLIGNILFSSNCKVITSCSCGFIAFWRMIFASAMLGGYSSIRPQESIEPKNIRLIVAAGFLLAMHFFSGSAL